MIERVDSSVERCRSVSSIRSRNLPPTLRAYSQLKSAERAAPMCKYPVGDGAKRTRVVIFSQSRSTKAQEPGRRLLIGSPAFSGSLSRFRDFEELSRSLAPAASPKVFGLAHQAAPG